MTSPTRFHGADPMPDLAHDSKHLGSLLDLTLRNRNFSVTRKCWSKGIGGGDAFMKLRVLSSGCESRPARGEPARAGNEPFDGRGNAVSEA